MTVLFQMAFMGALSKVGVVVHLWPARYPPGNVAQKTTYGQRTAEAAQSARAGHHTQVGLFVYLQDRFERAASEAQNLSLSAAGENIAAGQGSVQDVIVSWLNSPGHCKNMMEPSYQDIGVACISNDGAPYGMYWTMNLARP